MVTYFEQPKCMLCEKPIEGVAIKTEIVLLKLDESKKFAFNSLDDKFIIPKYIHEECYWSKMNK